MAKEKYLSTEVDSIIQKRGLLKKEILILAPFVKEPWKEFTLTEIKQITQKKSHHYVFNALRRFAGLGIITLKKCGNTNIYYLNCQNRDFSYLVAIENAFKERRIDIPYQNILHITEKIKSPFYTLLIGGSYAEGKQKPTSDLDVSIIIPDADNKKSYQIALKDGEMMIPEIHSFVFTASEMYQMLINNEFNLGKELVKKHIVFYGAEAFYILLFEALKHGFKG